MLKSVGWPVAIYAPSLKRRLEAAEITKGAVFRGVIGRRTAKDLLALNIDLASVMQAGRWKTNRMPMRYGEHVLAARGYGSGGTGPR
jgi:hypothetical protein